MARRKVRKLLDDPATVPLLRADLIAGLTTLPTWMQLFLKDVLGRSAQMPSSAADNEHNGDHDDEQKSSQRPRRASANDRQDYVCAARPPRRSTPRAKSSRASKA